MGVARPLIEPLASRSRGLILENLLTGPKSVTELVSLTGLKQPNVSNHLARLRESGVVVKRSLGRQRIYSLASGFRPDAVAQKLPIATPQAVPLKAHSDALVSALLNKDERQVQQAIESCLTASVSLVDLYSGVVQPAFERIGALEACGEISVADEHFASEAVLSALRTASERYAFEPENGRTAILGGVEGNQHVIGLWTIADVLRHLGWRTIYLGANVPTRSFVSVVSSERGALVAVACSLQEHLLTARELIHQLLRLDTRPVVAVGGRAVACKHACDLGADLYGSDAREFLCALRTREQGADITRL